MPLPAEADILSIIDSHFPNRHKDFLLGRGDDCAVFKTNSPLAVSSDVFIEDVHFRRAYFRANEVGYKALAVNLSDLAACAAQPLAFTLSLALPPSVDILWLHDFFTGMSQLAREQEMLLCGGDLSRGDKLQVSINVFGKQPEDGALLKRMNVRGGDCIFVCGSIGLAATGLAVLEEKGRDYCQKEYPQSFRAHILPKPLVQMGLQLGEFAYAGARISLMDVSDGIVSDLPRLLGAGFGAELWLPEENVPQEARGHALRIGADPAIFAVQGGEDYALLGTCEEAVFCSLQEKIANIWQLGIVNDSGKIICNGKWPGKGFDHFG